jgi:GNAT superfamily N-acetyltransferase
MIRATTAADTSILLAITDATGVFRPIEVQALREVLDDYHGGLHAHGHRAITEEEGGVVRGFAYYAPAAMTDRTWYLYWIAIRKDLHARGLGSGLLTHVEQDIRIGHHGRILLIETSSQPSYQLTRCFYLKHGYEQHAVLGDYYRDGDDMVVFRKRLD